MLEQLLSGQLVDAIRGLCQRRFKPNLPGRVRQQPVVSRKTGPSITQTRSQVFFPDPAVCADCIQNGVDVGLGKLLRDQPKLVGEADLHGDVTIDRNLCQLRAHNRHAGDVRLVAVISLVHFLHQTPAFNV